MSKLNTRDWRAMLPRVSNGEPFETYGAFWGTNDIFVGIGSMPADVAERFRADRPEITYVIMSYYTPIAWRLTDGSWRIPSVRYSVTTSKHQGTARMIAAQA